MKLIFQRLRLTLHPDKTRKLDLSGGKQGFDFLGCHLHKRMSGRIWENERRRVYFLQRWPSTASMKRVKQRVKELPPRAACHRDLRETIAKINPVIRGWANYFATGKFNQVDSRGIADCSDCNSTSFVLPGGSFWRVGVDLAIPTQSPNAAWGFTASYQTYEAGSSLSQEFMIGMNCWLR